MGYYTDGFGAVVLVHEEAECCGNHCVIHNPSDHKMRHLPTYWDDVLKLMFRMDSVNRVKFLDPDEIAYQKRRIEKIERIIEENIWNTY